MASTGRTPLTKAQIDSFVTAIIIGLLVGGRLGHIAFYEPELFTHFSSSFPFWAVLEIHRGGMSSHGGIIGIAVACVLFGRKNAVPILHIGDLACLVAPIGLGFGRMANWVNGELLGKVLDSSMQKNPPWWSVKYPAELFESAFWQRLKPEEIEGLRREAVSVVTTSGDTVRDVPQILHDACYAGNQHIIGVVAPYLTARYPNNFIQTLTDGVILLAAVVIVWLRPRKPGTIFGTFFLTYGALRILSEQFRVPDHDIMTLGHITLPITLSGAMVVVGLTALTFAVRSKSDPLGGLLPRPTPST